MKKYLSDFFLTQAGSFPQSVLLARKSRLFGHRGKGNLVHSTAVSLSLPREMCAYHGEGETSKAEVYLVLAEMESEMTGMSIWGLRKVLILRVNKTEVQK